MLHNSQQKMVVVAVAVVAQHIHSHTHLYLRSAVAGGGVSGTQMNEEWQVGDV